MLICFLLVGACQKKEYVYTDETNLDWIEMAHLQFRTDSLSFASSNESIPKKNFRASLTRQLFWEYAIRDDNSIFIPMRYLLPDSMKVNGQSDYLLKESWLVISTSEVNDSKPEYNLLTFFNDLGIQYKNLNDFRGTILTEDYFEGNVGYYLYEDGKKLESRTKNPNRINTSNRTLQKAQTYLNYECENIVIGSICVPDPTDDSAVDICNNVWEQVCKWVSTIDPTMPPPENTGESNPLFQGRPENYIDPDPPYFEDDEIIDSLIGYPCAQELLKLLPSLKNDIAPLIGKRFLYDEFDVLFKGMDLKEFSNGLDGKAYRTSAMFFTIILDLTMLKNATQEYILATMYHEALHAYMYSEYTKLGKEQFNINYTRVQPLNAFGNYKFKWDHYDISSYVTKIADAIQSFNGDYSRSDAMALAKYGIVKDLTNNELSINENERNGKSQAKGTKCP